MMKNNKKYRVSENFMDTVYAPADNIPYSENDKGMTVLKVENKGFFNFIAQKLFHRPRFSHISLDKYGTVLWKSLNGKQSVSDICRIMNEAFPEEKDRMLDRTIHFLRILAVNKFIIKIGKEEK